METRRTKEAWEGGWRERPGREFQVEDGAPGTNGARRSDARRGAGAAGGEVERRGERARTAGWRFERRGVRRGRRGGSAIRERRGGGGGERVRG
ncbi:hypothetical protein E8A74_00860 [Polyangium fumosum]|uniref:Uncharacterized protein n=1 Tax=Polyangium fumosum TaxID=889272 RepID=A0A4U1JMB4_9BACT|nr:hypothetical protein E8A74_00860 [Polyangium fumosum]